MKYFLVISNNLIVSVQKEEEVAELIAGNGGRIIESLEFETPDDEFMDELVVTIQRSVDASLSILDDQRQNIELGNMIGQKTKKELN